MKFDILHEFRDHLKEKYGKNTADKYYFAVKGLLDGLDFNSPGQIPSEEIRQRMSGLKTKNDFSAAKCGLMELWACFPDVHLPEDSFFTEGSKHKRNYKKRSFEPLKLDNVKRKISAIPDKKLKLAYRLMLVSGARVSEVSNLTSEDILIENSSIQVTIKSGKGGNSRIIKGMSDAYLAKELPKHLALYQPGEKVFYSDKYMKDKAGEAGFECHDLRRTFAKAYLLKQRQEASDIYTANGILMEAMGHGRWRTTRRYLRRVIEL